MTADDILREFMADVEAAGIMNTDREWPDLIVTYRKAEAYGATKVFEVAKSMDDQTPESEMLLRSEVARLQQLLRVVTEALEAYVEHYGDPLKVARAALAKARGEHNDAR